MDDVIEAHAAVVEAEELHKQVIAQRRAAVLAAHAQGHSTRQIAKALGLTHQRVAKIIDGNAPVKRKRPRPIIIEL